MNGCGGNHRHLNPLGAAVGADYLPVGRRHRVHYRHPAAPGDPAGHQRALGQAGGPVIHPGVGDFHPEQIGDQRLKLVDDLQRALAGLGLIGRVGRQEFAPRHQRLDHGGDEVVIGPGAQE